MPGDSDRTLPVLVSICPGFGHSGPCSTAFGALSGNSARILPSWRDFDRTWPDFGIGSDSAKVA